jgi:hypothetical protein
MNCLRILAICVLWLALPVQAHKASDSYLMLDVQGAQVSGQWDIALRDIDFALGLDADGDGAITWGELRGRHAEINSWALNALTLERGGECSLRVSQNQVDEHTDGAYSLLRLAGDCPASSGELTLGYRLLFDVDALHRSLVRMTLDGKVQSAVMSPQAPKQTFTAATVSGWSQLVQFFVQGVWHIWIGFDHILFLLALLLPLVLVREQGHWRPVKRFSHALREVLWVVTAFTVAHSVTLSLAALGLVELPSRLVESAIAVSVVVAALNNLVPLFNHRLWVVAFGFGLIHGFGFASVLADLGLPQGALVRSLVGFNVGVEAGQLAIVAVFLPLAYALRRTAFYQRGVLLCGSVLTLVLALVWLAERALDIKLISGR